MFVIKVLATIWAIFCMGNFHKGLKDYEFIKVKMAKDSSLHLLQEDDVTSQRPSCNKLFQ
jgi:hypothetical protein